MASITSGPHRIYSEPVKVIEPSKGWLSLNLGEVWRYRELLQLLVWRNTIVRYKQSIVGIGWALIQPLTSMVIFSLIFGQLAKLPSDGIPYPVFTYVALLPWQYFAGCLTGSGNSLVGGAQLVSKVYFPRLILPLSTLFTGLVDFTVSFTVLLGMMVWYRQYITITWGIVLLPLFLLMAMMTALAVGLWLTSLMVKYRDVQHLLPFLVQVWMYLTPVAYSATLIPAGWRLVYALNPMAGVIDGFRWALLGRSQPDWGALAISAVVTILLLLGGLYYFRRTEKTFVDIL
jgi:lipopolysaccharide transport system permease protein